MGSLHVKRLPRRINYEKTESMLLFENLLDLLFESSNLCYFLNLCTVLLK